MGKPESPQLEREFKFKAPLSAGLPDLRDLVSRTERLPRQRLRTAYFDTPTGRLWHRGITLRHRVTDEEAEGTWTLKLPEATDELMLRRTEVSWSGPLHDVPGEASDIIRGLVRRQPLGQLVTLDSLRERLALRGASDEVVAEIDDDTVTVTGGIRDGLRFRQVELELHDADPILVSKVTARLEKTGLSVETTPKLEMAMGFPDAAAVQAPLPDRKSSLTDVIEAVVTHGLVRLLDHDWRLRAAKSGAIPEDVHQARVATRRLRSDLETFQALLDPVWVRHVRGDLKWLGTALGEVRDVDVLSSQFEDAPDQLRRTLARQRADASSRLPRILDGDRYLLLLDRLDAATRTPPVVSTKHTHPDQPASTVLPRLVGARWRSLRRQVRKAGSHPANKDLHRIRIKAKELRYAAEAAEPVIGKRARRTAHRAEHMQTLLGEHHDAVAAESWLRTHAESDMSPTTAFEAGRMAAQQDQRRRKLAYRWRRTWAAVAQSKHQGWLS